MTIRKGHHFDSSFGFTGSAGRAPVRGYMRGGTVKAGPSRMAMASGGKVGDGSRFAALKSKLSERGGVKNPGALAASIGRKKYGEAKMAKMSAAGRKKFAIGGLVGKGEYAETQMNTVRPGGAQQFAGGGRVPAGRVIKGGKNNVGLPKMAPMVGRNVAGKSISRVGGYAQGGMATLGKDLTTPGGGKWSDFKRGGRARGGRC